MHCIMLLLKKPIYMLLLFEAMCFSACDLITLERNTTIVCEHQRIYLSCSIGFIGIESASYGRSDRDTCRQKSISTTDCHAPNSSDFMKNRCDNKTACDLLAENNNFGGDPCVNTFKYLNVTYTCFLDDVTTGGLQDSLSSNGVTAGGSQEYVSSNGVTAGGSQEYVSSNSTVGIIIAVVSVLFVMTMVGLIIWLKKRGKFDNCLANWKSKGTTKRTFVNAAYDDGTTRESNGIGNTISNSRLRTYNNVLHDKNDSNNRHDDSQYEFAKPVSESRKTNSNYANISENEMENNYTDAKYGAYDDLGNINKRKMINTNGNIYDHALSGNTNDTMYDKFKGTGDNIPHNDASDEYSHISRY